MKKNFFLIMAIILIIAGVVVSYLGKFELADISGFAVTMFGAGLAAATLWGKHDKSNKLWVSVLGIVLIGAGAFALGFLGFAENTITNDFVSAGLENILKSAHRVMILNKLSTILFWIALLLVFIKPIYAMSSIVFILVKIFVKTFGRVKLDYVIDDDQKEIVEKRINEMLKLTTCKKVWRIIQSSKVIDKKYSGGASTTISRVQCKMDSKSPFPFKSKVNAAVFKSGKETIIFMPDKLFVIQKTKIGALNYSDISSDIRTTRFIESESVPKDSSVVGTTWKYVNKKGGPDRRFADNRQLPICEYGEIELTSNNGLNTLLMYSNPNCSPLNLFN